ncbi:MAG: hypothetical protein JWN44_845 [Myxococcales bacterium]|nr:hypothetical protein [Myxococcales bacterium]
MRDPREAKVKGTNMLSAVKALRTARDQARAVLPARLHGYLEERILVSSWYPEGDLMGLLTALGKLMPAGSDPFVFMGRTTAREHLAGIYRGHVRPGDLERTLRSGTALWRNYHDTGDLTSEFDAPLQATIRLRDFAAASREFCRLLTGYFTELLDQAGGKEVKVTKIACSLDLAPDCQWRLTWTT